MSRKNILFLTLSKIENISDRGIYTDLLRLFIQDGHKVFIASPTERRFGKETCLIRKKDHCILQIKTLNIQKTNFIEKGVGTLLLEYQFEKAIHKYFKNIHFDLILYSTPPITLNRIIEKIKKRDRAATYLLLKDIFPQNAVDIGMMSKSGILYRLFRKKERKLYLLSDFIGCMSPANVDFLLKHNPEIAKSKVEICPNSMELTTGVELPDDGEIKRIYDIPSNAVTFIYGGNLGKPQGLDFLLKVLEENRSKKDRFFLVVGSGTEYEKIAQWFETHQPSNAKLLSALPKKEYDQLVQSCDVGLIFLDPRFTIPNYPSRLLSYLEYKMPVLMATDLNTDIGKIAEENGYGLWCENGDLTTFNALLDKLANNSTLRTKMGEQGYKFLKENYTVKHSYEIIMKHFA
ncbi:MAG: glycosyltransferase family 4 protein [Proteiniphilum sp.]